MLDLDTWRPTIVAYRNWLAAVSPKTERRFLNILSRGEEPQIEAAVSEAIAWDYLTSRSQAVSLAEDPDSGGPDFKLTTAAGDIVVEVTNISIAAMTEATSLPHKPDYRARSYKLPTGRIKKAVMDKAAQMDRIESPQIVLVSTLHFQASAICFTRRHAVEILLSGRGFAWQVDEESKSPDSQVELTADMKDACFTKRHSTDSCRQNVSAVVLGGFGLTPPAANVLGALNPDALRPLDQSAFGIPYCRFRRWPPDPAPVEVEWTE